MRRPVRRRAEQTEGLRELKADWCGGWRGSSAVTAPASGLSAVRAPALRHHKLPLPSPRWHGPQVSPPEPLGSLCHRGRGLTVWVGTQVAFDPQSPCPLKSVLPGSWRRGVRVLHPLSIPPCPQVHSPASRWPGLHPQPSICSILGGCVQHFTGRGKKGLCRLESWKTTRVLPRGPDIKSLLRPHPVHSPASSSPVLSYCRPQKPRLRKLLWAAFPVRG